MWSHLVGHPTSCWASPVGSILLGTSYFQVGLQPNAPCEALGKPPRLLSPSLLQADEIALELHVVHHPHTISEFEPHSKQSLDVDEAHYHFGTAPGVTVDAQALLQALLQEPNSGVEGGWCWWVDATESICTF